MPALKKRALNAKQQRLSGSNTFNSGLMESLSELVIDPTYVPDDESGEEDTDEFPCVFTLIEGRVESVDLEEDKEVNSVTINIGEKRSHEAVEDELSDRPVSILETDKAISLSGILCKFWKDLFVKVS